jgi:hypothetical protein
MKDALVLIAAVFLSACGGKFEPNSGASVIQQPTGQHLAADTYLIQSRQSSELNGTLYHTLHLLTDGRYEEIYFTVTINPNTGKTTLDEIASTCSQYWVQDTGLVVGRGLVNGYYSSGYFISNSNANGGANFINYQPVASTYVQTTYYVFDATHVMGLTQPRCGY